MKMTKQQIICQQLMDMGFEEKETRSTKYRVFGRPEISRNLYIGRKGAIRYGNNLSESMSMSPKLITSLQKKFIVQK